MTAARILRDLLQEEGCAINCAIEARAFSSMGGGYGVVATKSFSPSVTLVTIPLPTMLTATVARRAIARCQVATRWLNALRDREHHGASLLVSAEGSGVRHDLAAEEPNSLPCGIDGASDWTHRVSHRAIAHALFSEAPLNSFFRSEMRPADASAHPPKVAWTAAEVVTDMRKSSQCGEILGLRDLRECKRVKHEVLKESRGTSPSVGEGVGQFISGGPGSGLGWTDENEEWEVSTAVAELSAKLSHTNTIVSFLLLGKFYCEYAGPSQGACDVRGGYVAEHATSSQKEDSHQHSCGRGTGAASFPTGVAGKAAQSTLKSDVRQWVARWLQSLPLFYDNLLELHPRQGEPPFSRHSAASCRRASCEGKADEGMRSAAPGSTLGTTDEFLRPFLTFPRHREKVLREQENLEAQYMLCLKHVPELLSVPNPPCGVGYPSSDRTGALLPPPLDPFPDTRCATLPEFLWAFNTLMSRGFAFDKEVWAMMPWVDYFNYALHANCTMYYDRSAHRYTFKTTRTIAPGEQLFLHYGSYSDFELLMWYGFCLRPSLLPQLPTLSCPLLQSSEASTHESSPLTSEILMVALATFTSSRPPGSEGPDKSGLQCEKEFRLLTRTCLRQLLTLPRRVFAEVRRWGSWLQQSRTAVGKAAMKQADNGAPDAHHVEKAGVLHSTVGHAALQAVTQCVRLQLAAILRENANASVAPMASCNFSKQSESAVELKQGTAGPGNDEWPNSSTHATAGGSGLKIDVGGDGGAEFEDWSDALSTAWSLSFSVLADSDGSYAAVGAPGDTWIDAALPEYSPTLAKFHRDCTPSVFRASLQDCKFSCLSVSENMKELLWRLVASPSSSTTNSCCSHSLTSPIIPYGVGRAGHAAQAITGTPGFRSASSSVSSMHSQTTPSGGQGSTPSRVVGPSANQFNYSYANHPYSRQRSSSVAANQHTLVVTPDVGAPSEMSLGLPGSTDVCPAELRMDGSAVGAYQERAKSTLSAGSNIAPRSTSSTPSGPPASYSGKNAHLDDGGDPHRVKDRLVALTREICRRELSTSANFPLPLRGPWRGLPPGSSSRAASSGVLQSLDGGATSHGYGAEAGEAASGARRCGKKGLRHAAANHPPTNAVADISVAPPTSSPFIERIVWRELHLALLPEATQRVARMAINMSDDVERLLYFFSTDATSRELCLALQEVDSDEDDDESECEDFDQNMTTL